MNPALALAISMAAEITATLSLKAADGMTRPLPGILVVAGYGLALWLMSTTISALPIGFVYALWSGVGMIGAAIGGRVLFGEPINPTMMAGMGVIAVGMGILAVGQSFQG